MGDHPWTGKLSWYVTSRPDQLSYEASVWSDSVTDVWLKAEEMQINAALLLYEPRDS